MGSRGARGNRGASDGSRDEPLPVAVLAGFLGSGKTTLLNRILTREGGERVAVVVNEFGDVPIDGRLVVRSQEALVELANGCVCCEVRGDLVVALRGLLASRRRRLRPVRFERIVVEGSGLASPGPILQSLALEADLAEATRASAVVTVAEAPRLTRLLPQHPEVAQQIGYADVVLLNHADRASAEELAAAREAVLGRNPGARVEESVRADVPLDRLFDGTSAEATLERARNAAPVEHTPGASAVVLRGTEPLDLHRLKMWLGFLAQKRSHELWRIKGIVACAGHERALVVQGVHQLLEIGPAEAEAPSESVLVVIGRELDEAELGRGWAACAQAARL